MYRITNKVSIIVAKCNNQNFLMKSLNHVGQGGKPFTQTQLESYMLKQVRNNPFEMQIKNHWKFHKLDNSEFIEKIEQVSQQQT